MTNTKTVKITNGWLTERNACRGGKDWFNETFPKGETFEKAIKKFDRPDWLIWLAFRALVLNRAQIIRLALVSARYVVKFAKDDSALKCIETVEAYVKGEATIEQVREARRNVRWYYSAADADARFSMRWSEVWNAAYAKEKKILCGLIIKELASAAFKKAVLVPFKAREEARSK